MEAVEKRAERAQSLAVATTILWVFTMSAAVIDRVRVEVRMDGIRSDIDRIDTIQKLRRQANWSVKDMLGWSEELGRSNQDLLVPAVVHDDGSMMPEGK